MKLYLYLLLIIPLFSLQAQKNIYQSDKFESLSENHKILAILPFITNLELKEDVNESDLTRLEAREGYAVQDALQTYFGRGKKRKKFSVDFQNTKNTNAILAQKNITYENIDTYTIKELSEILKVDGIVSGNMNLNILLSEGVTSNFSFIDYILGDANYGRIGIKVSDGNSGKLLWKYEKEINKKSGRNTTDLIESMMKKATRKFPYDKER